MKKPITYLIASLNIFLIFCVQVALAGSEGDPNKIPNPIKSDSLSAFFENIVSVCIELGTIVAVLGIIYGGFLYVTAQGSEEKLEKAYKTITWALVGTAILLGARAIMAAISGTVGDLASK